MIFYKQGTISSAANSDIVTGKDTSFVDNVRAGDLIVISNNPYEVIEVLSATQLKVFPKTSTDEAEKEYFIAPIQGYDKLLYDRLAQIIGAFSDIPNKITENSNLIEESKTQIKSELKENIEESKTQIKSELKENIEESKTQIKLELKENIEESKTQIKSELAKTIAENKTEVLNKVKTETINSFNILKNKFVGVLLPYGELAVPDGYIALEGQEIADDCPILKRIFGKNLPDMRGFFVRGHGGNSADILRAQDDAIRNLEGSIAVATPAWTHGQKEGSDGIVSWTGASQDNYGAPANKDAYFPQRRIKINASLAVPTAQENRPINKAWKMLTMRG